MKYKLPHDLEKHLTEALHHVLIELNKMDQRQEELNVRVRNLEAMHERPKEIGNA